MPDKAIQRKWQRAEQKLRVDFGIPSERLHLIDTIKRLFGKYVEENNLSDNASIALYYRLSFFSILMTVRTLNTMDMQLPEFRLNDIMPIYIDSKRLSAEAEDCMILEKCIANINDAIDALIKDYQ
ncbi:MAG: hypothetical protein RI962_1283 [Pseudomonadota bacterium]|jgi:hypothetical protein|nr:hypothetical protein [Oxalobacteraceae bacterium]